MDSPEQCAVLVPAFGAIEPEVEASLSQLADRGYVVRILRGSSQIDLARSTLATRALRDGFEETMWIDADVAFNPDDVDRIRANNQPFTAGLYVKKGRKEFAGKFKDGTNGATFGIGGSLLEMQYVGMGFTHIRREVYETIASELQLPSCLGGYEGERVTPYFIPAPVQEGEDLCYLSEDFSFCTRARQVGFAPLADTRIKLGHIGKKKYTWDDLVPQQEIDSLCIGVDQAAVDAAKEESAPATQSDPSMSAKLYEQLGRKQETIEAQDAAYQALMDLLAKVVSGDIATSRLLVNLTARTWEVSAQGERPAMPATVNGQPVCIIAPEAPDFVGEIGKLKADKAMLLGAIEACQRGTLSLDEFEINGDDCKVVLKSRSETVANG